MSKQQTLLHNRYRIKERIGGGTQGVVYLALDLSFNRNVAIKIVTHNSNDESQIAADREAYLLGRLRKHSALPAVFDYFSQDDCSYLVMEYISGNDLNELMSCRGVPFEIDLVLGWADTLLEALDRLHNNTPPIIHRDIKPQNLKLSVQGEIVLLDFGLAKDMVTGSLVFGYTPSYAPPEQRQGLPTDVTSDLYALGATLYHLMTGVKPIDAVARLRDLVEGLPDPLRAANEVNSLVPAPIAAVITKTMALKQKDRPAGAMEVRRLLLEASQADSDDQSTVIRKHSGFRIDIATLASKELLVFRCGGPVLSVAISPDEEYIASCSQDKTIRLWYVKTGSPRILVEDPTPARSVSFSPNGRFVAFGGAKARLWDLATSCLRESTIQNALSVGVSPDNKFIAVGCGSSSNNDGIVYLWYVGNDRVIKLGSCGRWIRALAVSPDSRLVASASWDPNMSICIWNVHQSKVRVLAKTNGNVNSIAFSPDGKSLASASKEIQIWNIASGGSRLLGECNSPVDSVAFSPNGKSLLSGGREVQLWDVPSGKARVVGKCDDYANSVAFSWDGRRIVLGSNDRTIRVWSVE